MASYPDWREPVRMLSEAVGPATAEQRALAKQVGLALVGHEPRAVTGTLIEDHLSPKIWGTQPDPATDRQRAFLHQLGGTHADDPNLTKNAASAWIQHHLTIRTVDDLIRVQPAKNDAVISRTTHEFDGDPTEFLRYAIVSSVGADGLVYFKGGNGQCARPHRLTRAAAADDPSDYPQSRPISLGT